MITNNMEHKYRKYHIGGDPHTNKVVSLDEALIFHLDEEHQYLVGVIETISRKLRNDILPSLNTHNIEIFSKYHILYLYIILLLYTIFVYIKAKVFII